MAGVLTNVIKGSMLANADTRFSRGATPLNVFRARLLALRADFASGVAPDNHATKQYDQWDGKVARTPDQVVHTRDHFFGDPPQRDCFFPGMSGNTEDDIVRGAYIRAIDLALGSDPLKEPKPIVSYWIINGRTDSVPEGFEVFVSETPLEVHVLMLTPYPAVPPPVPDPNDPNGGQRKEKMWLVSTAQRIAQVDSLLQTHGYSVIPVTLPVPATVECRQVVGY